MGRGVVLGYEVGTGATVSIPIAHMAVTGQTQASGKTTTLEALVARSGVTALAFITKRGEGAFTNARRIPLYFRERADWQFVDQLLEAQLREKNKFLRPWIIKICRSTRTLADVLDAVRLAHGKAKGISEGVYTQLEAYLELIVPEIERARFSSRLALEPGLNVIDVSEFATPLQMLFVQSAIDWVNEREKGVVVVIPEAWEFIPESKGSPVKASAISLVRKGAALGNYLWADSQDMAGVDKTILRGCTTWLIGVQREANEIKRNLDNIPAGVAKPKSKDVALLEIGQFFACHGHHVAKTYVQPAWASDFAAREAARSGAPLPYQTLRDRPTRPTKTKETQVNEREAAALREENQRLQQQVIELQGLVKRLEMGVAGPHTPKEERDLQAARAVTQLKPPVAVVDDMEQIITEIMRRIAADPVLIRLATEKPAIEVAVQRRVIQMDGSTLRGRIAKLLAEGGFDNGITNSGIRTQLKRTGPDTNNALIGKVLDDLLKDGFVTRSGETYTAVEGMKVNVVEA